MFIYIYRGEVSTGTYATREATTDAVFALCKTPTCGFVICSTLANALCN